MATRIHQRLFPPRSEVTFMSADHPGDLRVRCHDTVFIINSHLLITSSEYFRIRLKDQWCCNDVPIHFTTTPPTSTGFKAVLEYIYTGEVNVNTIDDLLRSADYLQMTLQPTRFYDVITTDNWHQLLSLADRYNHATLAFSLCRYVAAHHDFVVNTEYFRSIMYKHKQEIQRRVLVDRNSHTFKREVLVVILSYTTTEKGKKENMRCFYDDVTSEWYGLTESCHALPKSDNDIVYDVSLKVNGYTMDSVYMTSDEVKGHLIYDDCQCYLVQRAVQNNQITVYTKRKQSAWDYYYGKLSETFTLCSEFKQLSIENVFNLGKCLIVTIVQSSVGCILPITAPSTFITIFSMETTEMNSHSATNLVQTRQILPWQNVIKMLTQNDKLYIVSKQDNKENTINVYCYGNGSMKSVCRKYFPVGVEFSSESITLVQNQLYFFSHVSNGGIFYYSLCNDSWDYIPYPPVVEKTRHIIGITTVHVPRDSVHFLPRLLYHHAVGRHTHMNSPSMFTTMVLKLRKLFRR